MKINLLTIVLLIFGLSSACLAETIVLKSGREIKGEIIEKTQDHIVLDLYGAKITYSMEDIDSIDGAPLEKKEAVPKSTSYSSADNLYIDDNFGFRVLTPNWIQMQAAQRQIEFREEPGLDRYTFVARFLISVDKSSGFPGVSSAISYATAVAAEVTNKYKSNARILEPAQKITVGPYEAAKLTYEMLGQDSRGNKSMVVAHYFYYLGSDVVVLMYMDGDISYRNNRDKMLKYLKSFTLIPAQDKSDFFKDLIKKEIKFKPITPEAYSQLAKSVLEVMNKKHTYKSFMRIKDPLNAQLAKYDYVGLDFYMTFVDAKNFEITQANYYANGAGDIWRVVGDDMYNKIGFWMPSPTDKMADENFSGNAAAIKEMLKRRRESYSDYIYNNYLPLLERQKPQGICDDIENFVILKFVPERLDFLRDYMSPPKTLAEKEVILWIYKQDNTIRLARTILKGEDNDGKPAQREIQHYFNNFDLPFTLGVPPGVDMMMQKPQGLNKKQ